MLNSFPVLVRVVPGVFVFMRMLAVHDMAWDERVHNSAYDLDAENAADEAADHDPGRLLFSEAAVYQRVFR